MGAPIIIESIRVVWIQCLQNETKSRVMRTRSCLFSNTTGFSLAKSEIPWSVKQSLFSRMHKTSRRMFVSMWYCHSSRSSFSCLKLGTNFRWLERFRATCMIFPFISDNSGTQLWTILYELDHESVTALKQSTRIWGSQRHYKHMLNDDTENPSSSTNSNWDNGSYRNAYNRKFLSV